MFYLNKHGIRPLLQVAPSQKYKIVTIYMLLYDVMTGNCWKLYSLDDVLVKNKNRFLYANFRKFKSKDYDFTLTFSFCKWWVFPNVSEPTFYFYNWIMGTTLLGILLLSSLPVQHMSSFSWPIRYHSFHVRLTTLQNLPYCFSCRFEVFKYL